MLDKCFQGDSKVQPGLRPAVLGAVSHEQPVGLVGRRRPTASLCHVPYQLCDAGELCNLSEPHNPLTNRGQDKDFSRTF